MLHKKGERLLGVAVLVVLGVWGLGRGLGRVGLGSDSRRRGLGLRLKLLLDCTLLVRKQPCQRHDILAEVPVSSRKVWKLKGIGNYRVEAGAVQVFAVELVRVGRAHAEVVSIAAAIELVQPRQLQHAFVSSKRLLLLFSERSKPASIILAITNTKPSTHTPVQFLDRFPRS